MVDQDKSSGDRKSGEESGSGNRPSSEDPIRPQDLPRPPESASVWVARSEKGKSTNNEDLTKDD